MTQDFDSVVDWLVARTKRFRSLASQNEALTLQVAKTISEEDQGQRCYSWEGEDVIAYKILRDVFHVERGTYVDVGAHHPYQLSNTYYFYLRGWRGINIDATPGSMKAFQNLRAEDINIETGIARVASTKTLYRFDDAGLNGFLTPEEVAHHIGRGCQMVGTAAIECVPLTGILDRHHVSPRFELLTVDAEGSDLDVLQSLDFSKFKPRMIIVEILGCFALDAVARSPVATFLQSHGYTLFSRLHFSAIFLDEQS